VCRPEEVASTGFFLLSDAASFDNGIWRDNVDLDEAP
jgi:hypothetical protein